MTTVVVPAAVANSAAMSFVDMPPVPSDVPRVAVDTDMSLKPEGNVMLTLLLDLLDITDNTDRFCVRVISRVVRISEMSRGNVTSTYRHRTSVNKNR
jgi:hypothetical protein